MLDINLIREDPQTVRHSLEVRQMDPAQVDQVIDLDLERRRILQDVEALKAERNRVSKEIGRTKDAAERQTKIESMRHVGDQISLLDERLRLVDSQLDSAVASLPNIPDPHVPIGKDDSENVVVRTVGQIPEFNFTPLPHWDLGPALDILNFEPGVRKPGNKLLA